MCRPVALGRAAAAFVGLLELLLVMAILGAGTLTEPFALCLLAASVAIALRAAVVGCYPRTDRLLVRSWLRTSGIDREKILDVRVVAYSGFANRFSDSRFVSMVSLEVVGRRLPVELRFTADTPSRVRERAELLHEAVMRS
ncbi:hypothetical protein [Cellulomonas wangsupingiae]|uniref:DUF304 domain-containing protein n=1 Tax=Cellulomonas wangsupingiae TaxID=2968085 RepID=A0ABY5K183_9CELL|nr:hypothetical protein [Cellulomonas wangsupingiae]MCC2335771.1 hypothetical protein [Cellulomonas wangsupingiae]UUI64004.1 hypothetical protein NP075_12780 [Cellulomonas wangsupingiae]